MSTGTRAIEYLSVHVEVVGACFDYMVMMSESTSTTHILPTKAA